MLRARAVLLVWQGDRRVPKPNRKEGMLRAERYVMTTAHVPHPSYGIAGLIPAGEIV